MQLHLNKENFHQTLNRFSTVELETLIEKFPYFQQAHLLLAKKYQQERNPRFDEQLQMAALYTQDRDLLFAIFNEAVVSAPITKTVEAVKEVISPENTLVEELKSELYVSKEDVVVAIETVLPEEENVAEEAVAKADASVSVEELKTELFAEKEIELPVATSTIEPVEETIAVENSVEEVAAIETETDPQTIKEVEEELTEQFTALEVAEVETFNTSEPHTFDEWLKAYAQPEISKLQFTQEELPSEPEQLDAELNKLILQNAVVNLHELVEEATHYSKGMNEFIEEQIQKHKPAKTKIVWNENELSAEIATETLAKLYEGQKKYQKAIRVYEVLRLKYPDKNDFFAAQIIHLKNIS